MKFPNSTYTKGIRHKITAREMNWKYKFWNNEKYWQRAAENTKSQGGKWIENISVETTKYIEKEQPKNTKSQGGRELLGERRREKNSSLWYYCTFFSHREGESCWALGHVQLCGLEIL